MASARGEPAGEPEHGGKGAGPSDDIPEEEEVDAAFNTGEDPLEKVVEVATVDTDEQSGQLQPQPGMPHSIVKGMKNLLAVAALLYFAVSQLPYTLQSPPLLPSPLNSPSSSSSSSLVSDVALLSPFRAPGVLDQPVVHSVVGAVTNHGYNVVGCG